MGNSQEVERGSLRLPVTRNRDSDPIDHLAWVGNVSVF